MIVWCNKTWFKTLPKAYFVSSRWAAISTASEIAIPKLPVLSGLLANIALPDSVSLLGLATHLAPKLSINARL